jgi:hypothetical protein
MGDTEVYWDDAGAESFWSTFKTSTTTAKRSPGAELIAAVDNWVEWFNN